VKKKSRFSKRKLELMILGIERVGVIGRCEWVGVGEEGEGEGRVKGLEGGGWEEKKGRWGVRGEIGEGGSI
jgi:hypothetical protein